MNAMKVFLSAGLFLFLILGFIYAEENFDKSAIGFDALDFDKYIKEKGIKMPIVTREDIECSKRYLEINDLDENLISRLELDEDKLNIQILLDKTEFYPHCYNQIKDCNEDEVDCVYEGDSCKRCDAEVLSLGADYLFFVILFLLSLSIVMLMWYVLLIRKKR